MGLLFADKTICTLCKKSIEGGDQIYSFPAFVQNTKDPFYQFNDSAFHINCLNKNPLSTRAIEFANTFIFKTRPENRICQVSGKMITDSKNYLFIDLLSSALHEDIYKFNFLTFDTNNIKFWVLRDEFVITASKFKNDKKWGDIGSFNYLDNIVELVSL